MSMFQACNYLLIGTALLLSGCGSIPTHESAEFNGKRPRSILVLPPKNNSVDVDAPYTYLSTISRPLAEKGYYVFPVVVIDSLLKENGLPTPDEMHSIPLDKIDEHIGADAVLYVTIDDWGQKFQVLSSVTVVKAEMKLVDVKTGSLLWSGYAKAQKSDGSGNSGGGLMGLVVHAIVDQVVKSLVDETPELARAANTAAVGHLSDGPYRVELITKHK